MMGVGGSLAAKVDACQEIFSKNFVSRAKIFYFFLALQVQGATLIT